MVTQSISTKYIAVANWGRKNGYHNLECIRRNATHTVVGFCVERSLLKYTITMTRQNSYRWHKRSYHVLT